jgi:hypothetical protein
MNSRLSARHEARAEANRRWIDSAGIGVFGATEKSANALHASVFIDKYFLEKISLQATY